MPLTCEMWIVQFGIEFRLKKNPKKTSKHSLVAPHNKKNLATIFFLEDISQENPFVGCPNAWLRHVGNRAASNNFPPDVTQRSHDTKIERPEFSLRRLAPISDNFHILGLHSTVLVQSWLETYLYQDLGLFRQCLTGPKVYPRSVQRKSCYQFACILVGGLLSCPKTIYHWQFARARW